MRNDQEMDAIVGIDPGVHGAIVVLNDRGCYLWYEDMPIAGKGRGSETMVPKLLQIFSRLKVYRSTKVLLEWPTTRPGEAAESSKRFGVGMGHLEALCYAALGAMPYRIPPATWKGKLVLPGKRDDPTAANKAAASTARYFIPTIPASVLYTPRGRVWDGRADAALIAYAGLRGLVGPVVTRKEDTISYMREKIRSKT